MPGDSVRISYSCVLGRPSVAGGVDKGSEYVPAGILRPTGTNIQLATGLDRSDARHLADRSDILLGLDDGTERVVLLWAVDNTV